ncbi:Crp/Fnr family transcriptional regulator [Sedimentibacter sp. zth1]|uniref:Crp/Fnr family transcriptional regulator n=1 Tax=Sedimentibacter sp. zth1 TaxID=2816908 RepID=UPI001A92BD31|nr:Crp/Fnr family transcriptional regulator [Sedimentibacter sp. zth1]QSX05771.1 Crp/Fnr family transcriptional regulator [Sedimentibacter sp. zth1]
MFEYLNIIKKSVLFNGILDDELKSMLSCLSANIKSYGKNEFIYRQGDSVSKVGMIMSGSVHIIKEDFWGNKSIITKSIPGQMFGETYACLKFKELSMSVVTTEKTEILFLDINKVLKTCSSSCEFHNRLIRNFVTVLAEKNIILNKKIDHMANRTIKEKILSYLSYVSQENKSAVFDIPFNRQQLADYLCVDRSALSNELGKLRDENIISFKKNHFELLLNE